MDRFILELLSLSKIVALGRSDVAVARILEVPLTRLIAYEAAIGLITGIHLSIQTGAAFKFIGFPLFLVCATVVWALFFAAFNDIGRDELPVLTSIFVGSSLIFLPGIIPILGPIFMQALFIAWPFFLARFISTRFARPPGKALLQLTLPILAIWLTIMFVFYLFGEFIISPALTFNMMEARR